MFQIRIGLSIGDDRRIFVAFSKEKSASVPRSQSDSTYTKPDFSADRWHLHEQSKFANGKFGILMQYDAIRMLQFSLNSL